MNVSKFTCELCLKDLLTMTTEEERMAEKNRLFPDLDQTDAAIVCDECFIKLMDYNEPGQKRYLIH